MRTKEHKPLLLMLCGYKGLRFFESIVDVLPINAVCSYNDRGAQDGSFEKIVQLCLDKSIYFFETKKIDQKLAVDFSMVFVVGWQYLLPAQENIIVFHDSLLPKYRGFSPTVSALINGEKEIGVTAFSPNREWIQGPFCTRCQLKLIIH